MASKQTAEYDALNAALNTAIAAEDKARLAHGAAAYEYGPLSHQAFDAHNALADAVAARQKLSDAMWRLPIE